jgi:hypothetical protein
VDKTGEVNVDDRVHGPDERVTGGAPHSHFCEAERRASAELARVEVMVGDRVSPNAQIAEASLAGPVPRAMREELGPEGETEATEVGSEVRRVRVADVELPSCHELSLHDRPEGQGIEVGNEMVEGFGVKVPAEPLELSREHDRVGQIDLRGREAASRAHTANSRVRGLDLVEGAAPLIFPLQA